MQPFSLKYKVGNLISAARGDEVNVIGHGCNCFNTMKSGIAPQVAKAFPGAEDADKQTIRGDKAKLGGFTEYYDSTHHTMIFNLYSQFGFWGRKEGKMDLNYEALRSSLHMMASCLRARERIMDIPRHEWKIGLPKIGAGLAGGDWGIIKGIIEECLGGFDVTIYVLKESEIG